MSRIEVVRDPECDAAWPEAILNIVKVETVDGRTHTASVPYYTGHFKKPMTDLQIEEKFRGLTDGLIAEAQQDEMIKLVWGLDNVTDLSTFLTPLVVKSD
jgi:2-methylcitrate dehydratase PrpD